MNTQTERVTITGAAGVIECALDRPAHAPQGLAVIAHPHPLHGGTMDNKVVQTLVRAFLQLGMRAVRFNFRGVGASQGVHDEGRGEADDMLAVIEHFRAAGDEPLALAGFSFGAYVATFAAQRLPAAPRLHRLVLVGPSTERARPADVPDDTLVIHGEADDVVPLAATLDWARAQQLPVIVMPGVGHFFHGQLPRLRDIVVRCW